MYWLSVPLLNIFSVIHGASSTSIVVLCLMLRNSTHSAVWSFSWSEFVLAILIRKVFLCSSLFLISFRLSVIDSRLLLIDGPVLFFKPNWWLFGIVNAWFFSRRSSLCLVILTLTIFHLLGSHFTVLPLGTTFTNILLFAGRLEIRLSQILLFLLIVVRDCFFHSLWSLFLIHGLTILNRLDWLILVHDLVVETVIKLTRCSLSQTILHVVIYDLLDVASKEWLQVA